jgi:hypothetical protein
VDAQQFIQASAGRSIGKHLRADWVEQLGQRLGRQQIVVHGIDPRSHAASMIIAADYHMKRIGLGLEPSIPEVPSYLDSIELAADGTAPPLDVLRWWFTLDYDAIQVDPEERTFVLLGRGARVQCENEFLSEQGVRVHTGRADPKNVAFAAEFSRHLDRLAEKFPVYRQLQGLCDLAMLSAIIRNYGLAERVDWQPVLLPLGPALCPQDVPLAEEVETIVRCRELSRTVFITAASGGVEVDPRETLQSSTLRVPQYDADRIRSALKATKSYSENPRWFWD